MAIVERLNREVMRHLRNIVFDRQLYDNWSLMLPFTNRILNSMIHSSTGMSPAEIIFGSSLSLNRGILAPLMEKEMDSLRKTCTYKEYVTISKLIEDFTALLGTEHVKALATSKEEMAIGERLNREVMRHLRNIV
jgi:hypothetical protein